MHYDVCVVGGGLAGLSSAYHLVRKGVNNTIVFEASDKPGGLLKSEHVRGFTFDTGGSHIIFSKDVDVLTQLLGFLQNNYVKHYRNTKIYYKGIFVKYPFENGLADLPPEERFECLRDIVMNYVRRRCEELPPPSNFLEWLEYVFGKAIARKYLIPYNSKLWKTDLREITLEWVGGRVPNPPIEDVMKAAVGLEVEGYKHQLNFYYPKEGGIESLASALADYIVSKGIRIVTSAPVGSIRKSTYGDSVKLYDVEGKVLASCRSVIYTAPINRSGEVLEELLGGMAKSLGRLKSVPLAVIGLGVRGNSLPYHWVYFPETEVPFHRVAFISNYSRNTSPPNHTTIIAEISFPTQEALDKADEGELVDRVIEGLIGVGIVRKREDVIVRRVWRWRDAYIIYNQDRKTVLESVTPVLKTHGIFLHGRFGSWNYLNMDAVFKRSEELAKDVIAYISDSSRRNH